MPGDGIGIHEVSEKTGEVPELGLFEAVDLLVLSDEELRVLLLIELKQLTVALANVPVVRQISPVLHAALDDHVAQFDFLPGSDLHFEQLVAALLEVDS